MNRITVLPAESACVSDDARYYLNRSQPRSPHLHLWQDAGDARLLVSNGSQLFDISPELEQQLTHALAQGAESDFLARIGVQTAPLINDEAPQSIPLHALSLAVAQKCNLGCTYCYAQQGDFGGEASNMPLETAKQAIDRLVAQTPEQGRFNLAFMGGEPLVNRSVLVAATEYAQQRAGERQLTPQFSMALY